LKDLFAKAEALVANANLTFPKAASKDAVPTETRPIETFSNEPPAKKAGVKKTHIEENTFKSGTKKTLSKRRKRALKRK
jgi:hypothetical protein